MQQVSCAKHLHYESLTHCFELDWVTDIIGHRWHHIQLHANMIMLLIWSDSSIRRVGNRDGKQSRPCVWACIYGDWIFIYTVFCIVSSAFQFVFRYEFPNKGGLEILYDCADGIDRDGDLDLADGELDAYRDKKSAKELNQLEVAIGDGMEFTIHGKRGNNQSTIQYNNNPFMYSF